MSYSSDMSAFECYPGSPSPSTSSTLSDSSSISFPTMDHTDLYSTALSRFMCPMGGCLFSILGCATAEELEQHMSMLNHYPTAIDESVAIMDNGSSSLYDDAWLSNAAGDADIHGSPTSSTYEFTFAGYEQPKRFPATSPAPTTPTVSSSSCDCPHCHATGAFVWPASNKSQKAGANSIYNLPTPLTIQMPGPPTIINVPAAPPPPTRKNTAPTTPAPVSIPAAPQRSNTSPAGANQYAVWQQQIQIAQVTEMIAAQQKQRKAHRRQLERSVSPASSVYSDAPTEASSVYSSSGVYGYPPRPHPYYASA